jgi:hypothetical protein
MSIRFVGTGRLPSMKLQDMLDLGFTRQLDVVTSLMCIQAIAVSTDTLI